VKKPGLDAADVNSYCPISNLSVISKLLERLVARQLMQDLSPADLPPLQSGFDRNRFASGAVGYSASRRSRRCRHADSFGSVGGIRHGRSRYHATATAIQFWHRRCRSPVVSVLSARSIPICTPRAVQVFIYTSHVRHSGGLGARTYAVFIGRHRCLPTNRLQSVLNAAARLVYNLKRSDHITDALICLHWLRASERIKYKVAVLTYKVIHGFAPRYLGTFDRIADLPGRRRLRSAETHCLQVPPYRLSTVGSRAFPVAGARIWNDLPTEVTSAQSLPIFRQRLKSFLFRASYPDLIT
jgi:hypothetical protein